jgi:1-deoxy-D-xylulose-5-phosphate reductoisomerase
VKKLSLLGSTGSIGRQTLDIVKAHEDRLKIEAMAAGSKTLPLFARQIREFSPTLVSLPQEEAVKELLALLDSEGVTKKPEILFGDAGLEAVATHPEAKTVVTGVMGFLGLKPTAAAIRQGKTIALANKETLVAAGGAIMPMVREFKAAIVPVDSEHSAIFQSLAGDVSNLDERLSSILLTGSGGPFRTWSREQIESATIDDALKHPNWSMGQKITIDSATLMNKGLEIIEARWLFNIHPDKIKVVIHPQSILHSAVEFSDGSIIGQMGLPDMRLPIHYALFYPQRVESFRVPRLNLVETAQLTFEEPDYERFPCLALAREIAKEDNTLPCVLNAANEIVVEAFLKGYVKFIDIAEGIQRVVHQHKPVSKPSLDDILEADLWARHKASELIGANAAAKKT